LGEHCCHARSSSGDDSGDRNSVGMEYAHRVCDATSVQGHCLSTNVFNYLVAKSSVNGVGPGGRISGGLGAMVDFVATTELVGSGGRDLMSGVGFASAASGAGVSRVVSSAMRPTVVSRGFGVVDGSAFFRGKGGFELNDLGLQFVDGGDGGDNGVGGIETGGFHGAVTVVPRFAEMRAKMVECFLRCIESAPHPTSMGEHTSFIDEFVAEVSKGNVGNRHVSIGGEIVSKLELADESLEIGRGVPVLSHADAIHTDVRFGDLPVVSPQMREEGQSGNVAKTMDAVVEVGDADFRNGVDKQGTQDLVEANMKVVGGKIIHMAEKESRAVGSVRARRNDSFLGRLDRNDVRETVSQQRVGIGGVRERSVSVKSTATARLDGAGVGVEFLLETSETATIDGVA
jgi:hypothetical protein